MAAKQKEKCIKKYIGTLNVDPKTGAGIIQVEKELPVKEDKIKYVSVPEKDFDMLMSLAREELKRPDKTSGDMVELHAGKKFVCSIIRHEPGVCDIALGKDASRALEQAFFK
jgi:hypothetical protein